MSLDTIDEILDALGKLGYPAKLTEVAWLLDKHMRRDKLIELVDGAQYSRRNRDVIDLVLGLVRDELREKSTPRHYRGNPNVVHHFDVAKVAPSILRLPPVNYPQYASEETEPDRRLNSPVRVVLDAASERKERCISDSEEANQAATSNN